MKASWDVPGYVVRKPLGLLGAAMRYRTPALNRPRRSVVFAGDLSVGVQETFVRRCWAWKFGPDFRAFEFGAHDYGVIIGIDDAQRLYEQVNVRPPQTCHTALPVAAVMGKPCRSRARISARKWRSPTWRPS